jgi:aspartate-semialdehyde dehydrogenase
MYNVGIAGATGLVGEKVIRVLEDRNFPVKSLRLFASERSEGKRVVFKDREYEIENLESAPFEGLDVAFFSLDEILTHKYLPKARKHCLVIDKSSAYRLKDDVPLVVPEVNGEKIKDHAGLIACPNCTTIPLVMVLAPLERAFGLKRVLVSTYQSASGGGRDSLDEYLFEVEFVALHRPVERQEGSPYPMQLADNVIPVIGKLHSDGYSVEEHKTMNESRKVLELPKLPISSTCVRVPTAVGHGLSVVVDLDKPATPERAGNLLAHSPGIRVVDDSRYPTPIDARDKDDVMVGRIRKDLSCDNALRLWIVADNLRKGAATNAVQIAELALKKEPHG